MSSIPLDDSLGNETTDNETISKHEPPPLVLVEGFLGGFGTQTRWGDFQNHWHDDSAAGDPQRARRAIFVR